MDLGAHILILLLIVFHNINKLCGSTSKNIEYVGNETELRNSLLTNYNYHIRPNFTSNLYVEFVLLSLNEINIESQTMSIMAVIHTVWYDERLKWNTSDYGGLEGFSVTSKEVWKPPLLLQNSADSPKLLGDQTVPFRVWSHGRVVWAPTVRLETSCEMQVFYFPFEEQECTIILFPYAYVIDELKLFVASTTQPVNLVYYGENAEWTFISASFNSTSLVDGDDIYTSLTYSLKFKRRWMFMAVSFIIPAVLNLILMLGVFTLHIESGEKMGYSLTVFLSYIVLMTLVGDMLPKVSTQISLLQIYLAVVLIVGCFSTLTTIFIINIYNRNSERQPVSRSTKTLVKWIILPLLTSLFWRHLTERLRKRWNNKIDNSDELKDDESRGILDSSAGNGSPPPISTISPCSMRHVRIVEDNNAFRQLVRNMKSTHEGTRNLITMSPRQDSDEQSSERGNLHLTESENEMSLYSDLSSPIPPTPVYSQLTEESRLSQSQGYTDDIDELLDNLKWPEIALMMDAFVLRVLGSLLLLLSIAVFSTLFSNY